MKWWKYLICFALIISGIFSLIEMVHTFTARSQVVGYVQYEKQKIVSVIDVNYDNVTFYETDTIDRYSFTDELPKKYFDGQKNNYQVLINNYPSTIESYKAGYIDSTTILYFYEIDGSLGAVVELNIVFEFYSTKTLFYIYATSTNKGMSKLNQVIESEGFNIKVQYSEYKSEIEILKEIAINE